MKILVTGANGLLGHHVVMQLLALQHDVNIVVRSRQRIYFDISKVTVVDGNFTNEETLRSAAQNCDAIIHIAAVTATNLLNYRDYEQVNVKATALLLAVANELNIKNIVFVSSANTIGYGTIHHLSDEHAGIEFPFTESYYAQSKLAAENLIVNASKNTDNHYIIINPSFMIGAYDVKPSSGKLILMGYRKKWMFVPNGGKNFVAASDVASAVCNALTEGKNGERYLATGVNLTFKEFYEIQSRVGDYRQRIILLPDLLLVFVANLGDMLRFFKIKTEICSRNIDQLTICEYYGNDKARKVLRMPTTKIETAIKESLYWFDKTRKIKIK
jgi:nucleoside-diphosphate-sugar epimerase